MLIYIERIKNIMLELNSRKFWGKLTIEVDFKDGGVVDVYVSPKEKIVLVASR